MREQERWVLGLGTPSLLQGLDLNLSLPPLVAERQKIGWEGNFGGLVQLHGGKPDQGTTWQIDPAFGAFERVFSFW